MRFLCWCVFIFPFFIVSVVAMWIITAPIAVYTAYSNDPDIPEWIEPFYLCEKVTDLFDKIWPRA